MNKQTQALIELTRSMDEAALAKLTDYARFLLWQRDQVAVPSIPSAQVWQVSLIDQFKQARVSASGNANGMDVSLGIAVAGSESRASILAHPPVLGEAIVSYTQALPLDVTSPHLRFSVAIRDGAQMAADNLVAFRVRMNGWRVWSTHTNVQQWQTFDVPLPIDPGSVISLELCTEAIGEHRFTWAVWGEPVILGLKGEG